MAEFLMVKFLLERLPMTKFLMLIGRSIVFSIHLLILRRSIKFYTF